MAVTSKIEIIEDPGPVHLPHKFHDHPGLSKRNFQFMYVIGKGGFGKVGPAILVLTHG